MSGESESDTRRPELDMGLLDRGFEPEAIESRLYEWWEASGFFKAKNSGEPYSIMIPPPNVTGTLHMGHAFQHTLMDALIRFARMDGKRTLWQMGTDHAGIATQMIVERRLAARNLDKSALGREAFIDEVWKWRKESGGEISRQLRRMGSSLDWSREKFTMDDDYANAVREAFVRCHEAGYIYRGKRLVNWDPVLQTAISDLEVESKEEDGSLWHIRYPLADNDGELVEHVDEHVAEYVTIATTRPETMLGDTAVAVNPDDPRFAHLIGKRVRVPIADREVPVIGDAYVSMEFGTGCLKVTPAHDFNDSEIGKRHGLAEINIFDAEARLADTAPAHLRGLDRFEARTAIVTELEALGLLAKVESHRAQIPRGDRSGAVIEPYLTDQWFMRMDALRDAAVEAVADGRVEFVPAHYANLFNAWMRDIRDWCISRQLWWGHRIPAWYDEAGTVYVGRSESEVRETHGLGDAPLRQDGDVLETWFSSSLWTFATLGWPESTASLQRFHPTSVLVTGHDIIFFWVARMIMMTQSLVGDVPFHQVYIHGLVRDAQGQKMSKSRGNGLDPLDLVDGIDLESLIAKRTSNLMQQKLLPKIERATRKEFPNGIAAHGVDALRFTFAALASTGRDVRFDLSRVDGYRNFCNKLWNAARFVLMNTKDYAHGAGDGGLAERWIRSRLATRIKACRRAFEEYRFDWLAASLYEFIWHEYCDWYLEVAKPSLRAAESNPESAAATQRCLLEVLEALLRALHPLMPFITEALWQQISMRLDIDGDTLMLQPYPAFDEAWIDEDATDDFDWMRAIITFLRTMRSERGLPPGEPLPVLLQGPERVTTTAKLRLVEFESTIRHLGRVSTIAFLEAGASAPPSAFELVGDLKVMVPLEGVLDLDDERSRIAKAVHTAEQDLKRINGKLANAQFLEKAPEEIVKGERQKAQMLESRVARLQQAHAALMQDTPPPPD